MIDVAVQAEEVWEDGTDWEALAIEAVTAALSISPHAGLLNAPFTTEISVRLADPATTEEERAALLQLQTALGGLDGALATASTEDIRNMARLLAANDPARWLTAGGADLDARVIAAGHELSQDDLDAARAWMNR